MTDTIKLTRKQAQPILAITFPEYNGRKITLEAKDSVTFYDTNWGGGTRNQYKAIQIHTGKTAALPVPAPWVNPFEGQKFAMQDDIAIVCHTIFCGHDCGITITVAPRMAKELTAPLMLTS